MLDPFGGTGTTMRVAMEEGFHCDMIEISNGYCEKIAEENGLTRRKTIPPTWASTVTGIAEKDLPLFGGAQDKVTRRKL